MRIQLDTVNKTVKVEQRVSLKELVGFLGKILPGEWESFEIDTNVTINNWQSPIIIEKHVEKYPYWYNNNGTFLCHSGHSSDAISLASNGVYNIETKDNANLG